MPRCGQRSRMAKYFPSDLRPEHQRNAEQNGLRHLLPANLRRADRRVPVVVDERGSWPGRSNRSASDFTSHVVMEIL